MDTSWWWALAAVVLLALIASVVDGWGRSRRPPRRSGRPGGRTRPPGRSERVRGPVPGPRPAEIWWASVPFEDGPGGKDRPCLVLAVRGDRARVAKITSRYRDERPGVIPLPPGTVGDSRGRPSFLETGELREVPVRDFRRKAGVADPILWDQVRHLSN
ncbi:type II toxin-antitoxin system PemK/MazF family toxin [Streptomyces europaeiscabiei]|uniref:type II toxin-antitoxin system PemK/MazF family toxin n=1 Tax=Streptomyces TaxID=1883 RepID=UPI000A385032|nr:MULTISPECIES: type II toxin-antitoxin system PemK/MazF family toxin [Streptomyces]MDX3583955.1 type II toxin-antitoxin system PemK/MazF family toxin [Streptomyces europaeiscabiei]MDX3613013.1 type II toxin-antitoxin system PemK/MazF family toxin [Streptomyces europaeiscabiei]MDX3629711.1 type II toxin-antitoxin system PemK/MazF family toxin [Streptomyces europaeiscabiei]MDX3648328.1 type II toxin-antitoxin system PemK/MazF family toxin [Streptomyces europaeiscabiei]WUD33020.1 type II toxin-